MKTKKVLSLILAVVFCMGLFVAVPVQAETADDGVVFFEGFDSLEEGDINGQGGWSYAISAHYEGVVDSAAEVVSYGTGKALKFTRTDTKNNMYLEKAITKQPANAEKVTFSFDYETLNGGDVYGFDVNIGDWKLIFYAKQSRFGIVGADDYIFAAGSATPLPTGKYHFDVVMNYVDKVAEVYCNGELAGTVTMTSPVVPNFEKVFFTFGRSQSNAGTTQILDNISVSSERIRFPKTYNKTVLWAENFNNALLGNYETQSTDWSIARSTHHDGVVDTNINVVSGNDGNRIEIERTENKNAFEMSRTITAGGFLDYGEVKSFSFDYETGGSKTPVGLKINLGWGYVDLWAKTSTVTFTTSAVPAVKENTTIYLTGAETTFPSGEHNIEFAFDRSDNTLTVYFDGFEAGKAEFKNAIDFTQCVIYYERLGADAGAKQYIDNIEIKKWQKNTVVSKYIETFEDLATGELNGQNGFEAVRSAHVEGLEDVTASVGAYGTDNNALMWARTADKNTSYITKNLSEPITADDGELISISFDYETNGSYGFEYDFGWGNCNLIAKNYSRVGIFGITDEIPYAYFNGSSNSNFVNNVKHHVEFVIDGTSLDVYIDGILRAEKTFASKPTLSKINLTWGRSGADGNTVQYIDNIKFEKISTAADDDVEGEVVQKPRYALTTLYGKEFSADGSTYSAGFGATVSAEKSNYVVIEAVKDNVMKKKYIESGFTASGEGAVSVGVKVTGVPADVIIAVCLSDMSE